MKKQQFYRTRELNEKAVGFVSLKKSFPNFNTVEKLSNIKKRLEVVSEYK